VGARPRDPEKIERTVTWPTRFLQSENVAGMTQKAQILATKLLELVFSPSLPFARAPEYKCAPAAFRSSLHIAVFIVWESQCSTRPCETSHRRRGRQHRIAGPSATLRTAKIRIAGGRISRVLTNGSAHLRDDVRDQTGFLRVNLGRALELDDDSQMHPVATDSLR